METIQEIIKKFETTKDKQIYSEIIERIKTEELLLISYMPFTNNYYLDFENGKPACYIFTEKKYYDEYQDYMMQQQIIIKHVENNENMEKTNADNGECVVKEKSIMQFPLITNSEDKSFYPFFTDWNEFRRFDKEQKFSETKDMLIVIESAAEGSLQNTVIKEQVAEKESKVMLGEPAEYPQKMIDEICKYLKTNKNVNAAYLRLMVKDNEQSYLIVVDFTGDKNVVFSSIANAGVPFSNGKYLDFVPLSSGFGKEAVENIIPFYKKKKFGIF